MPTLNSDAKQSTRNLNILVGILAAIGIVSVLLGILVGQQQPSTQTSDFVAKVLVSAGSAFVGTCLGFALSNLKGQDAFTLVTTLLRTSSAEQFKSDDGEFELEPLRHKWYVYHLTELDRVLQWRAHEIDFSASRVPGVLRATMTSTTIGKETAHYSVEGGVRNSRLIMFLQNDENKGEPHGVFVFPQGLNEAISGINLRGVGIIRTRSDNHAVVPVLACKNRLPNISEIDHTVDPSFNTSLQNQWFDLFVNKDETKIMLQDVALN